MAMEHKLEPHLVKMLESIESVVCNECHRSASDLKATGFNEFVARSLNLAISGIDSRGEILDYLNHHLRCSDCGARNARLIFKSKQQKRQIAKKDHYKSDGLGSLQEEEQHFWSDGESNTYTSNSRRAYDPLTGERDVTLWTTRGGS